MHLPAPRERGCAAGRNGAEDGVACLEYKVKPGCRSYNDVWDPNFAGFNIVVVNLPLYSLAIALASSASIVPFGCTAVKFM